MVQVSAVRLTKAKLAAMPVADRRLLLLLGHASNEINVYRKLIVMSGQADAAPGFADHVQAGMQLAHSTDRL